MMNKRKYDFPMSYDELIAGFLGLTCSIVLLVLRLQGEKPSSAKHSSPLVIPLFFVYSIYLLSKSCRSFALTQTEFRVYLLGIPVRRIPLNKLKRVVLLSAYNSGSRTIKKPVVVISVKPAPPYVPSYEKLDFFLLKHPFNAMLLHVPQKNVEEILAFLRNVIEPSIFYEY